MTVQGRTSLSMKSALQYFTPGKGLTMSKTWKIEEVRKAVVEHVRLRQPKQETIDQYAEAMKNGVVFPPLTVGTNVKDPTIKVLVDGLTRLQAAESLGLHTLEVQEKQYTSADLLLLDMYTLNRHGSPIDPKDRDNRIRLLAGEPYKWVQTRIAKDFGLDQSSVSRIVEGKQKAGTAGGTGESKSRKTFKPLTGKAIITSAIRMSKSLKMKSVKGDIAELCYIGPITDKPNPKNAERLDVLKDLYNELKSMFDHLEAQSKVK